MTRLSPLIYTCWSALIETAKWVVLVGCFGMIAFGFIYFGFQLERAASHYAHAERMGALAELYGSVDWSAKIEKEYKKRLAVERKLDLVCKKTKSKVCL